MNYKEDVLKQYKDVKPNILTLVQAVASGATASISLSLDKSFDFLAESISAFSYRTSDVTAAGYFNINTINLANVTNIIQGSGINSRFFSQYTALPLRFVEVIPGGYNIVFNVTNLSAFESTINIVITGKSLTGKTIK